MKFYFSNRIFLIIISLFFIAVSCSEETILYYEIENPEYTINTLTLPLDKRKVFQAYPSGLGTGQTLFFGNLKGSENLFSLVEFTLFAGYLPPTQLSDLLADSIQVDSAMVFVQTTDSLSSASTLSLYSVLADQDSIFSEDSTNFYSLADYTDFESVAKLIHEVPLESIMPDSAAASDTISFLFKDDNIDLIKEFLDTEQYPARTMMLKASDDLDQLFTIKSEEAGGSFSPKLRVWYKATVNDTTLIDTFVTFYGSRDISVVQPPEITLEDHDYVSLNSGSGNQSILQYDLNIIDDLTRNSIIKDARLVLDVESSNVDEGDDFFVVIAALSDTVSNWNFTTFDTLSGAYENENYSLDINFLVSRKIEDGRVELPIQNFIQLYKNNLIENHGLQIWSAPSNSPFDKVRLNTQNVEVLYVKP
ncbi:MAG: hypothetical protein VX678_01700 [Candidatus Neomarinimicrobiota bacterium]|nr:hypothetical protein [Candidatus Neomarinimicrobiota bacterium]